MARENKIPLITLNLKHCVYYSILIPVLSFVLFWKEKWKLSLVAFWWTWPYLTPFAIKMIQHLFLYRVAFAIRRFNLIAIVIFNIRKAFIFSSSWSFSLLLEIIWLFIFYLSVMFLAIYVSNFALMLMFNWPQKVFCFLQASSL